MPAAAGDLDALTVAARTCLSTSAGGSPAAFAFALASDAALNSATVGVLPGFNSLFNEVSLNCSTFAGAGGNLLDTASEGDLPPCFFGTLLLEFPRIPSI